MGGTGLFKTRALIGDDEIDILVLGIFELEFEFEFGIVSKFRFVRLIDVPSTRSHKSRKNISDLMSDLMYCSDSIIFVFVFVVTLPRLRSEKVSDISKTNISDL